MYLLYPAQRYINKGGDIMSKKNELALQKMSEISNLPVECRPERVAEAIRTRVIFEPNASVTPSGISTSVKIGWEKEIHRVYEFSKK